MNPSKWEEIVYQIEEKFGIDNHRTEDFVVAEQHDSTKIIGQKEIVEFEGASGKMKLERVSQPKVIDKKVLSSKRIGGKAAVDYVYSTSENTEYVKIYRWDETTQNWIEITSNGI